MKKRLYSLKITPDVIVGLLTDGTKHLVERGLPDGCDVYRAGYDLDTDRFVLILSHETFPKTEEGTEILELPVEDLQLRMLDPKQ